MVRALFLSVGQLGDPAMARVLAKSLGLTLLLFALFGGGIYLLADTLIGRPAGPGGTGLATVAALAAALLAGWLAFRAVAIAVIGLFADEVVEAGEARHYPAALAGAVRVPLARSLRMGMRAALRAVLANLLALPVYLLLLATGVGTAAVFFVLNGWLLGRDLGDMVAARHLRDAAMRDWRAATRARRFLLGLAATALFVVPLLGLLAPLLGAAMATHLFHGDAR